MVNQIDEYNLYPLARLGLPPPSPLPLVNRPVLILFLFAARDDLRLVASHLIAPSFPRISSRELSISCVARCSSHCRHRSRLQCLQRRKRSLPRTPGRNMCSRNQRGDTISDKYVLGDVKIAFKGFFSSVCGLKVSMDAEHRL